VVISDCQMPDVDGFMMARRIRQDERLRATPIVMLTSVGRSEDVMRCHRLGLDAYLTKPVKHSDLLDALTTLFGASGTPAAAAPVPAPRDSAPRALRILVAEDNPVNRKLVTTLLHKRGHHVTAVEDGRAAVRAVIGDREGFDIALMDVQMPEMSGFEATEAIRAQEAGTRHLPIVALTAHAMQGDRERCLAAGMDGYLAKPIDVDEMIATVEHFANGEAGAASAERAEPAAAPLTPFDERVALAYAGADRRLLKQVIKLFQSDAPGGMRNIARAIERQDGEALRLAAHALRGSLAAIGAAASAQAATDLEAIGRTGQFDAAADAQSSLVTHLNDLTVALTSAGLVTARAVPKRSRATRASRKPAPRRRRRP
jgi:CheY-like chemotaxis protein